MWTLDKLLHSVTKQSAPTYHGGSKSLACQNTVIALHLIFLNPANSNVEPLEKHSWKNRITCYGNTWKQHVQAKEKNDPG